MGKPTRVVARSRCVIIDLLALSRISFLTPTSPYSPVTNYSEQLDTLASFRGWLIADPRMLNRKDNAVYNERWPFKFWLIPPPVDEWRSLRTGWPFVFGLGVRKMFRQGPQSQSPSLAHEQNVRFLNGTLSPKYDWQGFCIVVPECTRRRKCI